MERLYDFEEEGIDGLMRMKEEEAMQNTEAKMKNLLDTAEELKAKLDDLTRYEIINQETTNSLDGHGRCVVPLSLPNLSELAMTQFPDGLQARPLNLPLIACFV